MLFQNQYSESVFIDIFTLYNSTIYMSRLSIEAMKFCLNASFKEASSKASSFSKEDRCDLLDGPEPILKRIVFTRGVRGDTKVFKSFSFDFEFFLGEIQ